MGTPVAPFSILVLISGNGSNLQAIIDATRSGLTVKIDAVLSDNPTAYGLERAKQAHIPTHTVPYSDYPSRRDFEHALQSVIEAYHPQLLVLAGFMRRLTPDFVSAYADRIINIHPSLLPKYPGLHTHRRVLDAQDSEHGVSVHYVTDILDGGPLIGQAKLRVNPADTVETLADRVKYLEHFLYPEVIFWIAQNRLRRSGDQVYLDNQVLPVTGRLWDLSKGARSFA